MHCSAIVLVVVAEVVTLAAIELPAGRHKPAPTGSIQAELDRGVGPSPYIYPPSYVSKALAGN